MSNPARHEDIPNLREVKTPEPGEDVSRIERHAWLYDQVTELGHPSLVDKVEVAEKFGISRRQVYYDLDVVAKSIEEHDLADNHMGNNMPVFEKAKREALREGDWEGAVDILRKQAEWLEDRGELDKEQQEMTWRHYIEEETVDV